MAEYGFPLFPVLLGLEGTAVVIVLVVQGFFARPAVIEGVRPRPRSAAPRPVPVPAAPAPPPPPQYKRAPISIHFRSIAPEFPDVWGIGEPLDIILKLEDPALQEFRQVPGLTFAIDGVPVALQFNRGVATLRHTFRTLGEKAILVDLRVKNEPLPRRSRRVVKIVDYRTEIADVFSNFREECSRAIVPIHHDATPWEIYDLLTGANPNLPADRLREIISCFEEAKFSNHPVDRATYERMISAILMLERVEL